MAGNVKAWNKVVNLLYMLMLTALFLAAGLDAGRFGWSTMPLFMKWISGLGCGVSGYVIWLTMEENAYLQPTINFGRYCNASARCTDWISSLPAKSAMVRESFRMR